MQSEEAGPKGHVLPTAARSEPLSPAVMPVPRPVEHQGGGRTGEAGTSGGWAAPKHQHGLLHDRHGETQSVHTEPPKIGAHAPVEKHATNSGHLCNPSSTREQEACNPSSDCVGVPGGGGPGPRRPQARLTPKLLPQCQGPQAAVLHARTPSALESAGTVPKLARSQDPSAQRPVHWRDGL